MTSKNGNEPHAKRETVVSEIAKNRRGWLKNGNPPGNPHNAPRCGAKSKRTGNPCKQPAMANGRCRLHGGKSTGPKTTEGFERCRKARLINGFYSQQAKNEQRHFRQLLRDVTAALKSIK
ncbi:MAG: hypothetical protein K0Q50_1158 [Vampirovibrio sp.]|jgi:hypothetical protein|nr:hypothetical protein [Vampirovibrio sp.]